MKKIILKIGGMSCSACSSSLEKYLNKQEGISASVNLVLSTCSITYEDNIKVSDLEKYISLAGFKSLGVYNPNLEDKKNYDKLKLIISGLLAILTIYIAMSHMVNLPTIPFLNMINYPINYSITLFILSLLFLIYGRDILTSGIKNLIHKSPNMDTLVTMGVISSFIYSLINMILVIMGRLEYVEYLYFESITTIIFFIKLGRFIDKKSKEKTASAIKELVQITPSKALLKIGDLEKEVTIDEVKKGDILIAKPGMKIAVDGNILSGSAHLDEAFITGEAISKKKKKNDKVLAGSVCLDGKIEYVAVAIGKNSTISNIVRLVVDATNTKMKIARLADKVSSYFVPTIILIAVLTFIGYLLLGFSFNEAIISFVTVLVVACPCSLGLATPLAIVISEGVCAKLGILVKSSETLEVASLIDTIVFDKTGTLTLGKIEIDKIFNYSSLSNDELILMVASLEKNSYHPIASAFKSYSNKLNLLEVTDFQNLDGLGLKGIINNKEIYVGNNKLLKKLNIPNNYSKDEENLANKACSIVYVILDNEVIGLIGVKDKIRASSKTTINKLKKLGIEIHLLTGDNEKTGKVIAASLGIDNVKANVLPNEKCDYIKDLIKNNKKVMMVGDGINDAPSLACSSVGVSINGGTDIAADASDVILMQDNLERIVDLLKVSKRTIRNVKQNLFWAFFYNICLIPIAIGLLKVFGIKLNPMLASLAMMLSSLTVIFNALRLRKDK